MDDVYFKMVAVFKERFHKEVLKYGTPEPRNCVPGVQGKAGLTGQGLGGLGVAGAPKDAHMDRHIVNINLTPSMRNLH